MASALTGSNATAVALRELDLQVAAPAAERHAALPGCACRGAGSGSLRWRPRQADDAAEPRTTPDHCRLSAAPRLDQGALALPPALPGDAPPERPRWPAQPRRLGPDEGRGPAVAVLAGPTSSDVAPRAARRGRLWGGGGAASPARGLGPAPPLPPCDRALGLRGPGATISHLGGAEAAQGCARAAGPAAQLQGLGGPRGARRSGSAAGRRT